ncbi:TPA: DUF3265 domain-containing protein, partial [Vibrio vulnificus]|nr:DUF3265 domain-containing protein [Vibrio vulnificus]HAS6424884.1 DUF3265 domain-containing protein [Vibrio vulnificus]
MERICLTNNLRVIRHAWHFYYALVLVIKVVCGSTVLRASHLNWALCAKNWIHIHAFVEDTDNF